MSNRNKNVSRRNFLRLSGLTGMALTVGYYLPAAANSKAVIMNLMDSEPAGIPLTAWITIGKDGKVTIFNHRSEMGQGSWQSVPQVIAEELEVDLNDILIQFAPGNPEKYGNQITGGSSTVRGAFTELLKTGASAREMLIEAASKTWNVPATECYAQKGIIYHKGSGRKANYGELVEAASKLQPPKEVKLKERKDYKLIGKPLPRQDTPSKVNGKAVFGIDKRVPGMLFAAVERNPRFLGKVKSFDDTAAKAIPGVKHVFKVSMPVFATEREGVAVVADNAWSAMQARKALKIVWDDAGFERDDSASVSKKMHSDLKKEGFASKSNGNVEEAFKNSSSVISATYETPFQSHACLEPLNCTAHFKEDSIEVWGPIQAPDWVRNFLSDKFKLPKEKVTVNMTFLGGGFGRKAFTDYPYEAVVISKEIKAPVQVVWSREDDMTQGPFRPAANYACKAVLENNKIVAFEGKMAAKNMGHQDEPSKNTTPNYSTSEGFLESYFETIPAYRFADVPTQTNIPVMWWRSVYASTNAFAYESFIDELAIASKLDPIEFRRQNVRNERTLKLLSELEEKSGWKNRKPNDGWGVAVTHCFDSTVGEVVKVSKKPDGKISIDKVIAVIDCGWYVNPDIIGAQVEGSIVMALGAAITHQTTFKDGMAVEKNYDRYRMPRINEIPSIEVHIVENTEKPGGVGEPALPPFAPALVNAIADLTGKRIRSMPFSLTV